jgi:predicted DNA-binding WGR domain protein
MQLDMFPTSVHLRCIDPAKNKRRYYNMSIQPTLFGEWALIREWGRIGRGGQIKTEFFSTVDGALNCLDVLMTIKKLRVCSRSLISC